MTEQEFNKIKNRLAMLAMRETIDLFCYDLVCNELPQHETSLHIERKPDLKLVSND